MKIYKQYIENGIEYVEFGSYPQGLKRNKKILKEKEDGYCYDDTGTKYALYIDKYYAFKPIKWRVLQKKDNHLLLMSEKVIDVYPYGSNYNYKESSIRKFLLNAFYNTAFNTLEKLIISDRELALTNLKDKVFLMSDEDMQNEEYGFSETFGKDENRAKEGTDYVRAKLPQRYKNYFFYVLRSSDKKKEFLPYVCGHGLMAYKKAIEREGVCPAIWIEAKKS